MIGLIAGDGRFPLEIARAADRRGVEIAAVAFPGITDEALAREVAQVSWQPLGQLQAAVDFLRGAGVGRVVMAGKVSKVHLARGADDLQPDARARALLGALPDLRDDSILGALADFLAAEGIGLAPQTDLVPELLAPEGILGRVQPTSAQCADVAFGWPIAKRIGGMDIGQTVVVHERAVLAVEAIEGTDEAVRRAGKLARPGLVIVKVAKPDQDLRFDLPAVGLETLEAAGEAGAAVLAFEAGKTVIFDRAELVRRADAGGIALIGARSDGSFEGAEDA